MTKQIEVHGQRVELYSLDEGRTWSSNPQSIVAYRQRNELLRLELQNSFARIDEMRDLDPDNFSKLDTSKASPRQGRKIVRFILGGALTAPAAWIATKSKLALLTTEAFIGTAIYGGHPPRPDRLAP